jgi:hypothetical protein
VADRDPDFEAWIQEARDVDILAYAQAAVPGLKKAGGDWHASCPVCGGKDKNELAITPAKRVFLCRKSGVGGDVIKLAEHVLGIEFVPACEAVLDRPPPRRDNAAEPVPLDEGAQRERREERRDADNQREIAAAAELKRKIDWVLEQLSLSRPVKGTQAEAYLNRRGIVPSPELVADLRWIPALNYNGRPDDDAPDEIRLGAFPAMLSPIRDVSGEITGLHATYLDLHEPIKLKPPGSRHNKAKKMLGAKKHGLIRLGPICPIMAIGEGIETVLSWYQLGVGPDDLGIAAAGDLGNLAGSAKGTIRHPKKPGKTIPNGEPDMDKPGMILPDEVRELILLGDGDSDAAFTRAILLTAARRQRALGRIVSIHMAPSGMDFNDMLRGESKS